ncbi:uncharacterized protein At3g49140 isoform X2 [Ziziphus jujuba]|uniref:Uncharacterized protein At3g49140 isoform X2 n=1 Tax=Ziziphus jujuba TaxID=326968 RepID=A0ABM3ICL5_ZIZJJ|nr:uncharacterized protein At3g49140 isoform X2 [Ziziphus jujuba]
MLAVGVVWISLVSTLPLYVINHSTTTTTTESVMTSLRFTAGANFCSSTAVSCYRPMWSSEDVTGVLQVTSCRLAHSSGFDLRWNRFQRTNSSYFARRNYLIKNRIQASTKHLGPGSDPIKKNGRPQYHPFEDIAKSTSANCGDAILTSEETARTIIEVNSKATLMFSGLIDDEVHENVFLPDLPYVTDEHGNIYFQVKNGEDTMRSLTSDNNFVQVIIGLDTMEILSEMDISGPSEIDFGIEEIEDEDGDIEEDDGEEDKDDDDDDDDTDWVAVLEDEEDEDDSDMALGDWAKLETMRASHPMYFAKKLAEVASDDSVDWMEQPPASLAIQGLIRPAFIEEHSVIRKHLSDHKNSNLDGNQVGENVEDNIEELDRINGHKTEAGSSEDSSNWAEDLEQSEIPTNGATFYKLEMIRLQLFSSNGNQEAVLIGVDSLGFDLRICSGTQVETVRFSFDTRATSEYSAERQLNDLLFPRIHPKPPKFKQTHQNEC